MSTSQPQDENPTGLERRLFLGMALGTALLTTAASAQGNQPAPADMNELGPENEAMAQRVGLWDVAETVWGSPGAAAVTTKGLVAERRMIGSMLQEILRSATDQSDKGIRRIDYLTFHRVEGRWEYVSMDLRAPVGIMSAWSFDRGADGRIDLTFAPFAFAFGAAGGAGEMLRMSQVIALAAPERDAKDQSFIRADGTGTKWLAHQYAYTRRA